LGGIYFTFNMCVALITSLVSVDVFVRGQTVGEEAERALWPLVSWMCGVWLGLFGVFLLLMKKEFRGSFFSFETASTYAQNIFLNGRSDEAKMTIFEEKERQWRGIRGEVEGFVRGNLSRWKEEQPVWFDSAFERLILGRVASLPELVRRR